MALVRIGRAPMRSPANWRCFSRAMPRSRRCRGAFWWLPARADAAVEPFRQAYEAAPNSEPLFQRYLGALVAAKRFPEARTAVQARLDKESRQSSAQGAADPARRPGSAGSRPGLPRRGHLRRRSGQRSVYDLTAADLYARNGKRAEAVALLEKSAAAHPTDPTIAVGLARLYAAGGDPGKAEALLSRPG